jgi:hypothetical protein
VGHANVETEHVRWVAKASDYPAALALHLIVWKQTVTLFQSRQRMRRISPALAGFMGSVRKFMLPY